MWRRKQSFPAPPTALYWEKLTHVTVGTVSGVTRRFGGRLSKSGMVDRARRGGTQEPQQRFAWMPAFDVGERVSVVRLAGRRCKAVQRWGQDDV